MNNNPIDIKENELLARDPELLQILLRDNTLSTDEKQVNIMWATESYVDRGEGYAPTDQITIESITGENGNVIQPRSDKNKEQQRSRSKSMAEVFTPSWICNKQNNLIDNVWFGRENVFNTEDDENHTWNVNLEPIVFPEGKSWTDYVEEERMEITCGEAPYLVSRYDTVSGEFIVLSRRIGLLDRKLRVVSENAKDRTEWLEYAYRAYMTTYGFDWQGDNVILAREALLETFIEYYKKNFKHSPRPHTLKKIAKIISWNIWQMDGLKGVIPNSCKEVVTTDSTLFGNRDNSIPCPGCKNNKIFDHTGSYALIKSWKPESEPDNLNSSIPSNPKQWKPKHEKVIRFVDLLK